MMSSSTTTTTKDEGTTTTTTTPIIDASKMITEDNWFIERGILWPGQAMAIQVQEVLYHQRSIYQDIMIFRSTNYGIVLVLDGVIQVTERDEFSYQEMITHIPLFSMPSSSSMKQKKRAKHVLCIGGGDGGVLREICKHTYIETITICEIDQDVITVSKKYLPTLSIGYNDPRVIVHVGDGFQFLQQHPNTYDVIITDSSDPVGPANVLFDIPYYELLYNSLTDIGIICTQGECVWLHLNIIQPLIQKIKQIPFTSVEYAYTTIPTYPSGQIGFIIATKGFTTTTTDTTTNNNNAIISCRIPQFQPSIEMQRTLQYYNPSIHTAAFCLPSFAHRSIYGSLLEDGTNDANNTDTTTTTE